ncbi:hypothetical protein WUBG_16354, partial [Wuchereria bancrofti]
MAVENDLNKATVEDIDSIRKIPFETAPLNSNVQFIKEKRRTEMVPSQIPQPVYAALKNGTFIDNIDAFDLEQIQPFLPSLLLCSFSSACVFSDESL